MSDHLLAVWGATTGTVGSAVAITTAVFTFLNRRDATWSRRARAQEARPVVEALRTVLVEVQHSPAKTKDLTHGVRFAARLGEVDDAAVRCPDRRTRASLTRLATQARTLIAAAVATESPSSSYHLTSTTSEALSAATAALDRMTKLDRKKPG